MKIFNLFLRRERPVVLTAEAHFANLMEQVETKRRESFIPKVPYEEVEAALLELVAVVPSNSDEGYAAGKAFEDRMEAHGDSARNHIGHVLQFLHENGKGWVVILRHGRLSFKYLPLWVDEYKAAISVVHAAAESGDALKLNAAYHQALAIQKKIEQANGYVPDMSELRDMLSMVDWPGYPAGYWNIYLEDGVGFIKPATPERWEAFKTSVLNPANFERGEDRNSVIIAKFEEYDPSNPFDMFDYLSYLDIKTPDWRSGPSRIKIEDRVEAMKTAAAMRWQALDLLGVATVERIDSDWGYDWKASDYCGAVSKAKHAGLFVQHPTYAAELRKNYYAVAAALLQAEIDHLMQAHGVAA
ncbi:hypothetical protein AMC83_PA00068 (plasmid) [Rhizobium phaseoli]|uniref:hypothetical protein n=1 Tax=Rhizobium phaseoli TaxID=396 RepID=UPI0007EAD11F|nr:hypothetical protein [Rhizobium phaseoli]ANL74295.1 hypothetical protein AMC83_PA00068 [Rhizobium phaseoli]